MANVLLIQTLRLLGRGRRTGTAGATDDPYALLGVGRQASAREIRTAYLRLVKELHPDGRASDPQAGEADARLKAINAAYRELTLRGAGEADGDAGRRARPASTLFVIGILTSAVPMLGALAATAYYGGWFRPRQVPSQSAAVEEAGRAPAPRPTGTASDHVKDPSAGRQAAWAEAEAKATREAWNDFIKAYPDGKLADRARQAIASIDHQRRRKAARLAWTAAQEGGTKADLRRFLAAYPESEHAAKAKEALAALAREERRRKELAAWAAARRSGAREALEGFLAGYPESGHAAEAEEALAALAREERRRKELAAWAAARRSGAREALEGFLAAYPESEHAPQARDAIAVIAAAEAKAAAEARAAADLAAWTEAERDGGVAALNRYLTAFPSGDHAAEARARVARLEAAAARLAEAARKDDLAWRQARRSDSREAYTRYLSAHPDGRRAPQARERLAELRQLAGKAKAQPAKASPARSRPPVALAGRSDEEDFFVGADGRIRR